MNKWIWGIALKKCGCYYLLDFSGMSLRQVVDCLVWRVISDKR